MKIKNKSIIAMIVLLLVFLNTVPVFAYTELIRDNSNKTFTNLQIEEHNEAGNQLAAKGIYVYYQVFDRNTSSSIYDTIRADYFEKYTVHKETDKIAILYYFIEDVNYDNGCMYYYDDNSGLMNYSKIDELNTLMNQYNKKRDYGSGVSFLYNNVVNEIAKTQKIELKDYNIIAPKYGGLNFIMIPTFIMVSIVITCLFVFRKKK